MHENSIKTYYEELKSLTNRQAEIFNILQQRSNEVFTDRELKELLHYGDMNAVRPRITEMIKKGIIKEQGTTICNRTNKSVRIVRCIPHDEYERMQKNQTYLDL